ncbi:ferredoxin [Nocardioides sp. NPDC047086]|uniref:ferredoxin n=1 Tax=Nocardioides sp. NPDC047086 TaxID=3154810 RepID=UPI0033C97839
MNDHSQASIDRELCKGHGRCYMSAPAVFDSDDEGFGVVVGEATTPGDTAALERAVNNCPERAIAFASSVATH